MTYRYPWLVAFGLLHEHQQFSKFNGLCTYWVMHLLGYALIS